jgi:hypothetical protein
MKDIVTANLTLNRSSEIRLTLREYKEKKYADVRTFVLPYAAVDDKDSLVPTPKGVSIPISKLEEFAVAVNEMVKRAKKEKLI